MVMVGFNGLKWETDCFQVIFLVTW